MEFEIYSLSDLTEEELWESVEELKRMVEGEIEWREEREIEEAEEEALALEEQRKEKEEFKNYFHK